MKRFIFFIFLLSTIAFGCVTIPDTLTVEDRSNKYDALPADSLCNPEVVNSPTISLPVRNKGLSASGFSLLSWNIQKEKRKGWQDDLVRLSQNVDILLIQEAFLSEELRRLLNLKSYHWQMVTAFDYPHAKAGVLTAAVVEPDFVCPLRAAEPLIRFPKTVLITRYPLANRHQSVMIANIHMINLTPTTSAFYDQATQITQILMNHQGPMIVSGDFNTWSKERLAIIEDMAARLNLDPADFKSDLALKVFGHTVDRVYYRGLRLEGAQVIEVSSSDHNPLRARFRLYGED